MKKYDIGSLLTANFTVTQVLNHGSYMVLVLLSGTSNDKLMLIKLDQKGTTASKVAEYELEKKV